MIRLAYASSAKLAVIPLQDVLMLDDRFRMNIPGTPSGNWRFRLTEEMLKEELAEGLCYVKDLFGR